jgi:hypothetical protein
MFKRRVELGQEYLAFLLLNLCDLFLTGYIFKHSGEEANGIAKWVLATFHKTGFAIFKFLMLAVIIILIEAIASVNLKRAKQVIIGACTLYVGVIIWEVYLILSTIENILPVAK